MNRMLIARDPVRESPASQVVLEIIREHSTLSELSLHRPSWTPALQDRLPISDQEQDIINCALELKAGTEMAFWDALLLCSFQTLNPPTRLLSQVTYHQATSPTRFVVSRRECENGKLSALISATPSNCMLALCSAVRLNDGTVRHIPMLDFHVPARERSVGLVVETLKQLDAGPGYILDSGKSYHFYGETLLMPDQFHSYLGKCLLFGPIVDRSWIAHQILEGFCSLRISAGRKSAPPPRLISRLTEA